MEQFDYEKTPPTETRVLMVTNAVEGMPFPTTTSTPHDIDDLNMVEDLNCREDYDPNFVEEARRWGNNKAKRSKDKRKVQLRMVRASKKRNRQ
jgi:hypothetical protein